MILVNYVVLILNLLIGVIHAANSQDFIPKVTRSESSNAYFITPFDDSTTILRLDEGNVGITTDDGLSWKPVKDIDYEIARIGLDSFNRGSRAFAESVDKASYYITEDQGKTWRNIEIDLKLDKNEKIALCSVEFHPSNYDYHLVHCSTIKSDEEVKSFEPFKKIDKRASSSSQSHLRQVKTKTFISTNNGKKFSEITIADDTNQSEGEKQVLKSDRVSCSFAKKSVNSGFEKHGDLIFCKHSLHYSTISDDKKKAQQTTFSTFFRHDIKSSKSTIVEEVKDKTVYDFEILNQKIVVIVQDDKYNPHSPKHIWVSNDCENFQEAYVPTQLRLEHHYQITEDAIGRIILSLAGKSSRDENGKNGHADILFSNSAGTKFSKMDWLNEDRSGYITLKTYNHLKGTMIGSFHAKKAGKSNQESSKPSLYTKITRDNGVTWSNLKVVDPNKKHIFDCNINEPEECSLQSITFFETETEPTAGIMMTLGVVNDGVKLNIEELSTFISRDGGATWEVAFEFPTRYAFGDYGNVIIAVPYQADADGDPASEIFYSTDKGQTWAEYQLKESIVPMEMVSTTPDGSGVKFVLSGFSLPGENMFTSFKDATENIYTIDFTDAYGNKHCKESDFEEFSLADGKCINGATYTMKRTKLDAKCLVGTTYSDLEVVEKSCEQCTIDDYECSFEFSKDSNGKCVLDYQLLNFGKACTKANGSPLALEPVQLIKGDKCRSEMEIEKVSVPCNSVSAPDQSNEKITVTENAFGSNILAYRYFDTIADESLILVTADKVFVSHDGGETMKEIELANNDEVVDLVFNPYFNSTAYLFGKSGKLYVTHDRGYSFESTDLPEARQLFITPSFNSENENTFIYYAGKDCKSLLSSKCHPVAYMTNDGGKTFKELLNGGIHCEFVGSTLKHAANKDTVICRTKLPNVKNSKLVSSVDYFQTTPKTLFEDVIDFMKSGEFFVVAVPVADEELRTYVTLDGDEFAEAKFPQSLKNVKQESFTILGSETGSIFLHLASNLKPDQDYGHLMKSNYNGTSFVILEDGVNRNSLGMVDFEKIQGLEGIILINTVSNIKEIENSNQMETLKTKITYNDGSDWQYLVPPNKDSQNKKYECTGKGINNCSLHLHGYTARKDIRDTYSSGSAIGFMIGVGNVGDHLLPYEDCSTFLTTDGGATWKEIRKGPSQWEYGDHGGVLVIIPDNEATNTLLYSINAGNSWNEFEFTGEKVAISDIVTMPGDSSMRFLLVGESKSVRGGQTKTYTLDFLKIFSRQCLFDIEHPDKDDYEYVLFNPLKNQCLFGHQREYLRKVTNDCFIGTAPVAESYRITKNCSCTRNDYECDYNYYKAADGTCKLVEGLDSKDPTGVCKADPNAFEYYEGTGYRKIPLSTCVGGLNLENDLSPMPCPGKLPEFRSAHGVSGRVFSLMFLIPFIIIIAFTWFIYDRGIRRNGGFSRFGEIRLEDNLIEENRTDKVVNNLVKFAFVAVSGLHSGVISLRRMISGRFSDYRSRMSGRSNPSYTTLFHDQFLDEADDLLEGHDDDAGDLSSFIDHDTNFEIDGENDNMGSYAPYTDESEQQNADHSSTQAVSDNERDGLLPDDTQNL